MQQLDVYAAVFQISFYYTAIAVFSFLFSSFMLKIATGYRNKTIS